MFVLVPVWLMPLPPLVCLQVKAAASQTVPLSRELHQVARDAVIGVRESTSCCSKDDVSVRQIAVLRVYMLRTLTRTRVTFPRARRIQERQTGEEEEQEEQAATQARLMHPC